MMLVVVVVVVVAWGAREIYMYSIIMIFNSYYEADKLMQCQTSYLNTKNTLIHVIRLARDQNCTSVQTKVQT